MKQIKEEEKKYKEEKKKINELKEREYKLGILEKEKEMLKNKLESVLEKIMRYESNVKITEENKIIKTEIEILKKESKELTERKEEILKKENKEKVEIGILENRIETMKINYENYKILEHEKKIYDYYLAAVNENGIPNSYIRKEIPRLENRMNEILLLLTNFQIKLTLEGSKSKIKSEILLDIFYPNESGRSIENGSGFERFVTSLALRIALSSLMNIPRSNMIIIDEGWGNFDVDNLGSVYKIMEYLRNYYEIVIIISHIDILKEEVDKIWTVKKENGYSKLNC